MLRYQFPNEPLIGDVIDKILVTRLDGIELDEAFEQDKNQKQINSREEASGQLFILENYKLILV